MLIYRMGKRKRRSEYLWPFKYDSHYTAIFEGWFLFGIIPLYIKQVTPWKRYG